MKNFFRFFVVVYFLFQILECANNEHQKARTVESTERYKPREVRKSTPVEPVKPSRAYTPPHDNVLEGDSLERMYDRNYMDFDYENNPDDDDEWYEYYND